MRRIGIMAVVLAMSGVSAWGEALAGPPERTAPLWHRSVTIAMEVHADGTADSVETWAVRGDTMGVAHTLAQQSYSIVADLDEVTLLDAATLKAAENGAAPVRIPVQPDAVMDQQVTTVAAAPQFSATVARTILFPAVSAGDTVRYTLRRRGLATLFPGAFTATLQPGWRPYLERADITIAFPPGMAVRVEAAGLEETAPMVRPDGGVTRQWRLAGRDGVSARGGAVLLDVSSFADYAALGEAYAVLAQPRSVPGPMVRALAARLTAGIPEQREQALQLYRYVATNVRYVALFLGAGRVVPRDSAVVLAEGFGDCKDHAALLQALLAAQGIEAEPALISLRSLYTLPPAPGLGALNHVITYVPALDLFLDSTAPYAPFGMLPAGEYDKPVVLAGLGTAGLARTPAVPPVHSVLEVSTWAQIGGDDVVSGTTTTEASGPQGIALRAMAAWIEGRGAAGAASVQLRQLGTPGTGGFRFDPPEQDAALPTAGYRVHARFTLDDALVDGGEAPFPLPGGLGVFGRPGKLLLGDAMTEEGGHVCHPGRETEEVALTLPPGARVVAVPPDVSMQAGGARYVSRYRMEGTVLRARREFTVEAARVFCDADAYAAMRGVLAVARRDQRVQVALSRPDLAPE